MTKKTKRRACPPARLQGGQVEVFSLFKNEAPFVGLNAPQRICAHLKRLSLLSGEISPQAI